MSTVVSRLRALAFLIGVLLVAESAHAFPGFIAGKGGEKAAIHSTHMAIMMRDGRTAVTTMPDYDGPIQSFALVMVVPGDVTQERVVTLKRDYIDRLEKLSAPRFHDFYEPDPCEPGEWGQEWERNLKASSKGAVLGEFKTDPAKKVAQELFVDTQAKKKEGEYELSVLDDRAALDAWLGENKFKLPDGGSDALKPYLSKGMKILVAKVDANRIELVGGDRAQLSPIRFWTDTPYDTIPVSLGLKSAPEFQELFLYILAPEKRYEVKNYKTIVPPTNVTVTMDVWERVGEFWNAMYDRILQKTPNVFLAEFAWPVEGCGQPCPDAPVSLAELMSLGGDAFEEAIPEDERRPDPGEPTEEEEKKFKASLEEKSPAEKKQAEKDWKEERAQIAYVKALMERNKYMFSRLHYRYNQSGMPKDPKIGPAGHLEGGLDLPKGPKGDASGEIKAAKESQLQIRFNFMEPSIKAIKCAKPERWRWGKRPREVRRLRKTWVADDLTRKSRTQIDPEKVVLSAVPSLGLTGAPDEKKEDAAAAEPAKKESENCGCRFVGSGRPSTLAWLVMTGLFAGAARRRRRLR